MEKLTTKDFGLMVMILCLIAILITIKASAQIYTDFGAGYEAKYQKPCFGLSVGIQTGRVNMEGIMNQSISRSVNENNYFGFNVGYKLTENIVPYAGYYYDLKSNDKKILNSYTAAFGIKILIPVQCRGECGSGLFINGFYARGLNVTVGIHAIF